MDRKPHKIAGEPLPDLFPLGRLGGTATVMADVSQDEIARVIHLHAGGTWCLPRDLLDEGDQEMNETVLADRSNGGPAGEVLSKYNVTTLMGEIKALYVITMLAGKSTYTTVCWPEER